MQLLNVCYTNAKKTKASLCWDSNFFILLSLVDRYALKKEKEISVDK